jgi:hypothetical protein
MQSCTLKGSILQTTTEDKWDGNRASLKYDIDRSINKTKKYENSY